MSAPSPSHTLSHPSTSSHRPWSERLAELRACPWYWGDISWRDAESLLSVCPNGTYLVRDSRDESHLFSVSYNAAGRVLHSRVGLSGMPNRLGSLSGALSGESVVELLENAVKASLSGDANLLMHRRGDAAHAEQLQLTTPLSRIDLLPPLQYLCRLTIRSTIRLNELRKDTRISPRLWDYLSDPKYIVPPIPYCVEVLKRKHVSLESEAMKLHL